MTGDPQQPKKPRSWLRRTVKYGAALLALVAVFAWWNLLRTPRLRISRETTYITEPRTSDGKRVDYFAALEKELYPAEMKTDDNGYRLMVRALGAVDVNQGNKAKFARVYEKLGLDPAIGPTMSYREPHAFLREYAESHDLDERQADELAAKMETPWTLDELPMMEPWLEENGPVLNLLAEAVRKPMFYVPLMRDNEAALIGTPYIDELQRVRALARILQTRANYRIGSGDIEGAIDDVMTCERLGRHMERQETAVTRLVGVAIEGIAASLGIAGDDAQPGRKQLEQFGQELNALPPRPDMERLLLAERYFTLDMIQAMAAGEGSLASMLEAWKPVNGVTPGIDVYLPVDWNIVMRGINAQFDNRGNTQVMPPSRTSLGSLLIGVRSRRVADLLAGFNEPPFQALHEVHRRTDCVNHLRRITLAMLLYERDHGALPPAYTVDAADKPLHSWRVLLLPYLGEDELYGKLHLNEPWDSEHNRRFHGAAPAVFQCPSATAGPGQTTFSVVVGEETAFAGGAGRSLADFDLGLMLIVEREQPVPWMEPTAELSEAAAGQGINRRTVAGGGIGSAHPGGFNAGFRDGGVRFVSEADDLRLLRDRSDDTAEEGADEAE